MAALVVVQSGVEKLAQLRVLFLSNNKVCWCAIYVSHAGGSGTPRQLVTAWQQQLGLPFMFESCLRSGSLACLVGL